MVQQDGGKPFDFAQLTATGAAATSVMLSDRRERTIDTGGTEAGLSSRRLDHLRTLSIGVSQYELHVR